MLEQSASAIRDCVRRPGTARQDKLSCRHELTHISEFVGEEFSTLNPIYLSTQRTYRTFKSVSLLVSGPAQLWQDRSRDYRSAFVLVQLSHSAEMEALPFVKRKIGLVNPFRRKMVCPRQGPFTTGATPQLALYAMSTSSNPRPHLA